MGGALEYLMQRAETGKRRLRDLFRNPSDHVSADLENIIADYRQDPLSVVGPHIPMGGLAGVIKPKGRSEEHTSELQSH